MSGPVHDTPVTIRDIFNEVTTNVYDSGLRWFSEVDIMAAIQEAYNKVVALLCPIEYSTFVPQIAAPYYPIGKWIPDFMYVAGIYNPVTNLWLEGNSYKMMKGTYQTYMAIGQPKWFDVMDFNKILIWPYLPTPTGVLYVVYKASAPKITYDHTPILPYSVASQLLEYFATADLMEQAREFGKATVWWDKLFKPPVNGRSIYDQAKLEIKNLARMDRELVLEPYRWILHGGQFNVATWINNETPVGTIDGSNATFTIAQVPNPSASVLLTKNGQILYNGSGYTLNGQTITFQTGYIPQPAAPNGDIADEVRAWYQVA